MNDGWNHPDGEVMLLYITEINLCMLYDATPQSIRSLLEFKLVF